MKKTFATYLLIATVFVFFFVGSISDPTQSCRFQLEWEHDLRLLKRKQMLPSQWSSISRIRYFSGDPIAKEWLRSTTPAIPTNKNGTFLLEILLRYWHDSGQTGAFIQYDLVDTKTNNTIWELNRTFLFKTGVNFTFLNLFCKLPIRFSNRTGGPKLIRGGRLQESAVGPSSEVLEILAMSHLGVRSYRVQTGWQQRQMSAVEWIDSHL